MTLSQLLLACSLSCSALALSTTAQADNTPSKTTVKKVSKAKPAAKAAEAKPLDEEAAEPAINDASVTEFDCELGNKITIYENSSDDAHIALRWKKRLHRLTRVGTSTGAHRFGGDRSGESLSAISALAGGDADARVRRGAAAVLRRLAAS